MKERIGLSTVYFVSKILKNSGNWYDLRRELDYFRVTNLELNNEIPLSWIKDIEKDVAKEEIKILSLHNFCPCIENIPKGKNNYNVYMLTSEDDSERNLGINFTKRTIDYAADLGAEIIIVHAGSVLTEPTGYELYKILLDYGKDSEIYSKYRKLLLESRHKNQNKYFNLILKSLDEIVTYAQNKNIVIGLETRFFPNEIPDFDEIEKILGAYNTKYLRYWHDFGHGAMLSKLGFAPGQEFYFSRYKKYLKGYHIHDLKGFVDHFAPGTGEIDFSIIEQNDLYAYILEVHSKEEKTVLKHSIDFVKNKIANNMIKSTN